MNSKKLIALFLALVMMLSMLISCAEPDNSDDDVPADPPATDNGGDNEGGDDEGNEESYPTITIAEALELCGEEGNITEERYYIRATVESIENATYGAMTIKDKTGSIYVYGTYSADGEIGYSAMTDKPYAGDEVLLHCILQNYNGTKEVKNARLIEFKHVDVQVNEADYTSMTIAEARDAEKGTLVRVDGVVAKITYADGMIPSGVMLVDKTQSIYVYDGDLAQRVQIGNKIEILAAKTYWILDSETANAEKFGYIGCNQLENAYLMSNDEKTDNVFDKSWIEEATVKEIMDNPVDNDITTTIFKVNALITRADGKGFINYYINDLDGKTGSYVYTQCSGSDFAYLDAFDGKICTVYLTVLNAKSTSSECIYRFLPIAVEDNGFTFDKKDTAEHVVKYYGANQFLSSYTGDPALELVTSVSSTLLGFENATITYTSSNPAIIAINTVDGKTVMNCLGNGKATITVSCTFDGVTYTKDVEIAVIPNASFEHITIADAKNKNVGETVIIKGIVGPSVVNKSGFYIFDETGMIAVTVKDAALFREIAIGNMVVLEGTRDLFLKDGSTHAGQLCISNCTLLANYYGTHGYPTDKFITDKTLKDICDLSVNEQHTDKVYVVKATIKVIETNFYTSIAVVDGTTELGLYCSNANQYSFLKAFAGQEVTLEIAPCNWNSKAPYKGCVLAVYAPDGTIVFNQLNFVS